MIYSPLTVSTTITILVILFFHLRLSLNSIPVLSSTHLTSFRFTKTINSPKSISLLPYSAPSLAFPSSVNSTTIISAAYVKNLRVILDSAFSFIHCIPSLTNFYQPYILRLVVCPLLTLSTVNHSKHNLYHFFFFFYHLFFNGMTDNQLLTLYSVLLLPTNLFFIQQAEQYLYKANLTCLCGKAFFKKIFHIISINIFKISCKVGVARWGGKEGETMRREKLKAT